MAVVSGGNHDGLDVLSVNERIGVGGRAREAVLACVVRSGNAPGAGNARQACPARLKSRNQHAPCVIPSADEGQLRVSVGRCVRRVPVGDRDARPKAHRVVVCVLEEDAQVWLSLCG